MTASPADDAAPTRPLRRQLSQRGRLQMVQPRRLPRGPGSIRTSRPAPSPRPAATQRAKQEQGGSHAKGRSSVVHSSGRLAMGEKEANTRHPLDAHPMGPPQTGQAPSPWVRKTFRATAICSSRLAAAGDPTPPFAAPGLGLNCRPPYWPLPVSADQFPPDSHWAIASQLGSALADGADRITWVATIGPVIAITPSTLRTLISILSRSAHQTRPRVRGPSRARL